MIVAVEGMDGVGKTTIAHYLSEKYGFLFIDKPIKYLFGKNNEEVSEDLETILNVIYDYDDPIIKTWFFALGNLMGVRNFPNQDIIIDRHFISNYFWNSDDNCQSIYNALFDIIGKPDLTLILYADAETRISRIKSRDINDPDLLDMEKYQDGFEKMMEFVQNNDMPYEVVDTSGLTIEEVQSNVDGVMEKLLAMKESKNKVKKK